MKFLELIDNRFDELVNRLESFSNLNTHTYNLKNLDVAIDQLQEMFSELEPDEINQQQIMFSIEKSGLKKFINSLSHGLDTIVGERGVKLSGGQKQRIGIARALYKNPSILFLDEGTSALDDKTEKGIIESIRLISNHKTIIMISHKLSTLKYCDKVYEINKNKIELVC